MNFGSCRKPSLMSVNQTHTQSSNSCYISLRFRLFSPFSSSVWSADQGLFKTVHRTNESFCSHAKTVHQAVLTNSKPIMRLASWNRSLLTLRGSNLQNSGPSIFQRLRYLGVGEPSRPHCWDGKWKSLSGSMSRLDCFYYYYYLVSWLCKLCTKSYNQN